nr:MAG TPA: hypothetical protein [Caudoviricetes sp.]
MLIISKIIYIQSFSLIVLGLPKVNSWYFKILISISSSACLYLSILSLSHCL